MSKKYWNPETGEGHVFADDETPPENFLPHHPSDGAKVTEVPPVPPHPDDPKDPNDLSGGLTKAQIVDALKAGGIEFNQAASKAALTDQLISALKVVLTDRGVAYEENETAQALLDKVTLTPPPPPPGPTSTE